MNTIAIKDIRTYSLPRCSIGTKIAMSYVSTYIAAFTIVGSLYLLGIFDVGFLAPESFAIRLFDYINTLVS